MMKQIIFSNSEHTDFKEKYQRSRQLIGLLKRIRYMLYPAIGCGIAVFIFLFLKVSLSAAALLIPGDAVKPAVENKVRTVFEPAGFQGTSYEGWIQDRMQINVEKRLIQLDLDMILKPFVHRPGVQWWDGWALSGMHGHIKYNLIGLLTYYKATGSEQALKASKRAADLMYDNFVVKKRSFRLASAHMGMAATSVLEPIAILYRLTGEPRYLEFCRCWTDQGKLHCAS
jgi:hypothetical protein